MCVGACVGVRVLIVCVWLVGRVLLLMYACVYACLCMCLIVCGYV